jgi:hypothetical protein
MQNYIGRLTELSPTATFNNYRCLRSKLLWTCNACPDICDFVSMCSSITPEAFNGKDVGAINSQVRYLRGSNEEVRLKFSHLDLLTLHLLMYADALFGGRQKRKEVKADMYVCLQTSPNDAASWLFTQEKRNVLSAPQ